MATIKKWLEEAGFDFENGRIAYQPVSEEAFSPGWADNEYLGTTELIDKDHPILTKEFNDGFGSPWCPRFIAEDKNGSYHPGQYDGSTFLVKSANLDDYIGNNKPTPYVGG